jgi:hypothetical protein
MRTIGGETIGGHLLTQSAGIRKKDDIETIVLLESLERSDTNRNVQVWKEGRLQSPCRSTTCG